ncbi:esterase/lipase family protein [Thiobacillus denitrificans]|uniref:esterase/lipase family protein n=1 Tax=Thiobacillus denitrificans TaxID=36861 RepID=UPI00056E62B2|nr:alpha/beta hydrolase [Thiobacillus denitrificans]
MDLVLIHGMGRTPLSMARLRRRLRRAGHNPLLFGYVPAFETLQGTVARLVKLIDRRVDSGNYALVGHSLGTVIIRTVLGQLENRAPSACFFLAPPLVACRAARFFSRFRLYRWLTGEMGQLLALESFMQQLPMPSVPTRIYAGVGCPRAPWLPFGMEASDCILGVSEATGSFETESVKVPSTHTFIMNSKQVFDDMVDFLKPLA